MLFTLAIVAALLVAVLLGFAATRPSTFQIKRAQSIQAPADRIFPLIDDFHKWISWSPYEKLDPTMKKTFSGAPSGKGAVYNWAGNSKAGEGRMEIVEAAAPSRVRIKLDFLKPFEGHNTAEFTLEANGPATNVTWAMYGPVPFTMKVMSIFFSMDKMLGKEFAAGLANLKAIAESKQFSTKGA
jgi:Polyketide cyclase / dehydrase and lipid transport